MFSSPILVEDRDLQHLSYILHITENMREQSLNRSYEIDYLQGERSVPVRLQIPVDSLSPGVTITKLQGHVGVTEASEVSRAKAASSNNLHRHEADILGPLECLVQALERMV